MLFGPSAPFCLAGRDGAERKKGKRPSSRNQRLRPPPPLQLHPHLLVGISIWMHPHRARLRRPQRRLQTRVQWVASVKSIPRRVQGGPKGGRARDQRGSLRRSTDLRASKESIRRTLTSVQRSTTSSSATLLWVSLPTSTSRTFSRSV